MLGKTDRAYDMKIEHSDPAPSAGSSAEAHSTISADLKVVGDLHSAGHIQIHGTVEGDVNSRVLTIGEGAQVTGSISAETVNVCGAVNGQIKAASVRITKSAKVMGDISYQALAIDEGAFLEGHCRRAGSAKEKATGEAEISALKDAKAAATDAKSAKATGVTAPSGSGNATAAA